MNVVLSSLLVEHVQDVFIETQSAPIVDVNKSKVRGWLVTDSLASDILERGTRRLHCFCLI